MDIENILEQKPIIRSEQLPCTRVTAFSRNSLFLEQFLAQPSPQNLQTKKCAIFFCLLITFSFLF